MEQTKTIPPVMIDPWPALAMPVDEIQNMLTYLAYKINRPVTFRSYIEDEGYSENSVSVRIAITDGSRNTHNTTSVRLGDKVYELTESQITVDLDGDVLEEKRIFDDNSLTLAYVDHNRIIIPIELTATDNETSRTLLSYIIEHSVELLDYKMNGKFLAQRRKLAQHFCETFSQGVKKRIIQQEEELRDSERKADQAYYTILEYERNKPVIQKELEFLKKLEKIDEPRLFRTQAQSLIELEASGQYTFITANGDGSITATTSPVTIEYDGWKFHLGRYTVHIDMAGEIRIEALDPHPDTDYPHPHVASDGHPCLGNISADIPKMLGTMRIAEALQTLYAFLCEYNPDSPYEKISRFDPTGEYCDEDENPCDDCDERCSAYCIFECSNNDGQYECSDCYDYRTDYCYLECRYNEDFSRFSPCDDCDDKGEEYCYLECEYNDQWQLQSPCSNCEREQCNAECPFFEKLQELKEEAVNANT